MNEETKVIDEITNEEVNVAVEAIEENEGGILGLIVLAAAAVGTGVAAWYYKKSGKADERRIKKLEKKGYTVIAPEVTEEVDANEELDEETK